MPLPQDKLPKIPPFLGPKPKPPVNAARLTMLVSLAALTASS